MKFGELERYTNRYVIKTGYIEHVYHDGRHHYWDTCDSIWDKDLQTFVDLLGNPNSRVRDKCPVNVVTTNGDRSTDMDKALIRLNNDNNQYEKDLKIGLDSMK